MTPRDLLDEFDEIDLAPLSKRQRRRVAKARVKEATRVRRDDRKRAYHRKVAETRNAPRNAVALAILGVLFFGGLWVIGTVSNNDKPHEAKPIPMLTYGPATTSPDVQPSPGITPSDTSPERFAEKALTVLLADPGDAWRNYYAPGAIDAAVQLRSAALAAAGATSLTVTSVAWTDTAPDGHDWSGTAHITFRDTAATATVTVTIGFVNDAERIIRLDGLETQK